MFRRVLVLSIVATAMLAVFLTPVSASAGHRSIGRDGNDVTTPNDIRSTTRTLINDHGRHALRVVIHGYEDWPAYPDDFFHGLIKLDTNGGLGTDQTLEFFTGQDTSCIVRSKGVAIHMELHGSRLSCTEPLRKFGVRVTKHIRWKVITWYHKKGNPDRAPDNGWYG